MSAPGSGEEPEGSDVPEARVNSPSAALLRLAEACGITPEYAAWDGRPRRSSAKAIRAALAAMGIDGSDDEACHSELDRIEDAKWERALPAVLVMRAGESREIALTVLEGDEADVVLRLESGATLTLAQVVRDAEVREVRGRSMSRLAFAIPSELPLGWHEVEARVGATPFPAVSAVVVVPTRAPMPSDITESRPWGFAAQLYSIRSKASWGVGDLADLRDLCSLAALRSGADFLLINPLHAAEPVSPLTNSPYLPSSRLWIHPLYIRVEDIPEVAYMPAADRALIAWHGEAPRAASLDRILIDREAAWAAKKAALEEVFRAPRSVARQAAFDEFRSRAGHPLVDFATSCALVEERVSAGVVPTDPWPESLASPEASGVAAFRAGHADRVEFYSWLQWLADEQRGAAQLAARNSGMRIGIMADLAVGVHPRGADSWSLGPVLARGVGVGAPPDMYNQQGQDWSQPPWQPRALEEAAYRPFRDVVRASLRHSGALRIDHILGLFRLWWVPQGLSPDDGVYVRYDHEALVGILCLEAERAGAILIGEDLGTVEPWVSDYLASRGILGTTVFWFEKRADGSPRAPEDYRPGALASLGTHDLPPTAAYLAGEHVTLREKLGLLVEPVEEVRAEATRERAGVVEMLLERGWLTPPVEGAEPEPEEILLALHRALFASPATLTSVAITDAVGELRTQNQPGTDKQYPNWRVPLCDGRGVPATVDTLFDHPRVQRLIEVVRSARP